MEGRRKNKQYHGNQIISDITFLDADLDYDTVSEQRSHQIDTKPRGNELEFVSNRRGAPSHQILKTFFLALFFIESNLLMRKLWQRNMSNISCFKLSRLTLQIMCYRRNPLKTAQSTSDLSYKLHKIAFITEQVLHLWTFTASGPFFLNGFEIVMRVVA